MSGSPDTFPDKHPDTIREYSIDWSKDLGAGETIQSGVWTYTGDDTTLVLAQPNNTASLTSVEISGGTMNAQYKLECVATTSSIPAKLLATVRYLNIREVNVE